MVLLRYKGSKTLEIERLINEYGHACEMLGREKVLNRDGKNEEKVLYWKNEKVVTYAAIKRILKDCL